MWLWYCWPRVYCEYLYLYLGGRMVYFVRWLRQLANRLFPSAIIIYLSFCQFIKNNESFSYWVSSPFLPFLPSLVHDSLLLAWTIQPAISGAVLALCAATQPHYTSSVINSKCLAHWHVILPYIRQTGADVRVWLCVCVCTSESERKCTREVAQARYITVSACLCELQLLLSSTSFMKLLGNHCEMNIPSDKPNRIRFWFFIAALVALCMWRIVMFVPFIIDGSMALLCRCK